MHTPALFLLGYYGNEVDGVQKPPLRKDDDSPGECSNLMESSGGDEIEDDPDFVSVACTPALKPVITDRF